MVICLDPAAPYGGELPERPDISYFVTHPCHPPIVNDEVEPEARRDMFGGRAKQHIVCALMQGPEGDYERGARIAQRMFAPVMQAHRVTVEQMAILEPALAETVVLTCMVVIREAVDEAIRRGWAFERLAGDLTLIRRLLSLRSPQRRQRFIEILYVQALLLGHHPLNAREWQLFNQGLLHLLDDLLNS